MVQHFYSCSSGFGSNIYLEGRWAGLSTGWALPDDGVAAVRSSKERGNWDTPE